MESRPDSATSDQDATTQVDAGLDAGGQEAGRVNGLMSTLGKRTSERDAAIAERDRLRAELEAQMRPPPPPVDDRGAAPEATQLPESTDEESEAPAAVAQLQAPPQYELPVGTVVHLPDGSQFLVHDGQAGTIAPTSPMRSHARPSTELEQARQAFDAALPSMVAEMEDRALLRGH